MNSCERYLKFLYTLAKPGDERDHRDFRSRQMDCPSAGEDWILQFSAKNDLYLSLNLHAVLFYRCDRAGDSFLDEDRAL